MGVQLVDEGDDLSGTVLDVVEDSLEAFLEFTAELGTGDHGPEVQGHDGLASKRFRDVTRDDALGKALHDRGLADAGLTDEYRVVLGTTREHLHDTANLGCRDRSPGRACRYVQLR